MGLIWTHDIPAKFEAAGIPVVRWPGWETRSRSSGGYDSIMAIGIHHDAGTKGLHINNRLNWSWYNSPNRPVGAMWIHTDGVVYYGAAGATNTQGKQQSPDPVLYTSKGAVPYANGNKYMFSIEMSNDGIGEEWPEAQLSTLVDVCAVLCEEYGLDPLTDIVSHSRYTPSRKVDPRGPTPSRPSWGGVIYDPYHLWDDYEVGLDVLTEMQEESVKTIVNTRLYDSRDLGRRPSRPNETEYFLTGLPASARIATVRVTTIDPPLQGWVKGWGWGNPPEKVTFHNYGPSHGVDGASVDVELDGNKGFRLMFNREVNYHVDLLTWET